MLVMADNSDVRWRLLVVAAGVIGFVGAAVLGADAVVAGVGTAAGLAGVMAGFCELAAFVLGVTGWAARCKTALNAAGNPGEATASDSADEVARATRQDPGERARYGVDARNACGLQIGDHNFQRNDFRHATSGLDVGEAANE
jgi:hypothetical protein